jgi:hypothetical protein
MNSLLEGLPFEDRAALLRWGMNVEHAWKVSGATPYNLPDDRHRIKWEAKLFSGIECGILAYLPEAASLDMLTVWMLPKTGYYRGDDALLHYLMFFDRLTRLIGAPTITPSSGGLYGPILTWHLDGCALQLYAGERMGDFCTLEITRGRSPRFKEVEQAAS